jgi:hypothetical protein
MTNDLRDVFLSIFEASLYAQLRAVRRLRHGETAATLRSRKGRSQVDMAYDVLKKARSPLHVSELLARIQAFFGVTVDRESLVSSLSKKVARQDRFLRTGKNTFSQSRTFQPATGGPMTLLAAFLDIAAGWRSVFPQSRTFQRAARQALGSLVCLGRRCLSRIIWTNGGQHRSWGAEYFLHSRCAWQPQELFRPILQRALVYCPGRLVGVAVDDTRCPKPGAVSSRRSINAIRCRRPST